MVDVTLNWKDLNFGESEQRIYRSTSPMNPLSLPTELDTVAADVQTYTDTTAVEDETYYYRVAAVDPSSNLYVSDEVEITASYPYPTDMEVYFTGDNVTGSTVIDEQGNYNGTIFGSVTQVAGQVGQAFNFPGSADYIRMDHAFWSSISEFTIACWIKTTSQGTWISKIRDPYSTTGLIFFRSISDQSDFRVGNTSTLSTGINFVTNVRDGNWHHVVCTYSASGHKLYVDGALDSSSAEYIGALSFTATSYWNIGRDGRGQDDFNGQVDDIRFYDYELTGAEILGLYNTFA